MTFTTLGRFRRKERLSFLDALLCVVSPVLAIVLRGMELSNPEQLLPVVLYLASSIICGLMALYYVQISKSPLGFISSIDLIKIFKVALAASVAGVIGTYFGTHLQFVPRFVPIIHFFLFSGLLTALSLWRAHIRAGGKVSTSQAAITTHRVEHQLLVGCTPIAVHYASLIDELTQSNKKIAGIVSIGGDFVGKTMAGRTVLGPLANISEILIEFNNHGIKIHRIIISTLDAEEQTSAYDTLSVICAENGIALSFLSDILVGASSVQDGVQNSAPSALIKAMSYSAVKSSSPTSYLLMRQRYEWMAGLILAALASPLLILIGVLTYFDIGRPVIFWQRRVGRFGHTTTVHKFRTLPHSSASVDGERNASWFGRLLQKTRFDELPQIFDILEGRLSFIGPRPLLPHDLPHDTGMRESVLPGVTGWAQVHGGKNVTPEEKIALDDWYLRHATPTLDLAILLKTLRVTLRGYEKRDDAVIRLAVDEFTNRSSRSIAAPARSIASDGDGEGHIGTSVNEPIATPNLA